MGRQGEDTYLDPEEACTGKCKSKIPVHNSDNLVIGVFAGEDAENVRIEIICKTDIKDRLIPLVLILLVIYLCYRLELIDAIESAIGNLIATFIIFLKRGTH